MHPSSGNRTASDRPINLILWFLPGILIGILFLTAAQLDGRWFLLLFSGALIFAASFAPIDKKAFYLALLVLTVPVGVDVNLYFQRSTFHHPTHGFLIALHHLPLIALYTIWASRSLLSRSPFGASTRGLAPLAGFFAAGVASVLLGGNYLFGAFDLFALLGSIVLFVYVSSELRTKRDIQVVLVVLAVAVWIQGVIALGQHLTGSSLGLEFFGAYGELERQEGLAALTRVGGTVGHPNALARFFDLTLPLGVSLLFCPLRARTKLLLGAAVGFGFLGLVLTLSRGGLVTVGGGSLLVVLLSLHRRIGFLRTACFAAISISMLLVVVFEAPTLIHKRFVRDDYRAALGRVPLIQVAMNIIQHHPFFGVGLNNYSEVAPRYDNTRQGVTSWFNSPVHNLFLYIAAETGVIGLVLYLIFVAAILRSLWPALRASDPLIARAGVGLAISMVAFFAHVQIEHDSITHNSLFWLLGGLAVSVGRLSTPQQPPS